MNKMYEMENMMFFFECYKKVSLWAFLVIIVVVIFFILASRRQDKDKGKKNAR